MKGLEEKAKISTHGGKRKGAGRPKGEQTKMVRVPVGCLEQVRFVISVYKGEIESFDVKPFSKEQKIRAKRKSKLKEGNQLDIIQDQQNSNLLEEAELEFNNMKRNYRRKAIKIYGSKQKAVQAIATGEGI